METIEISLIVTAVVQVIVLIVFFVMASNVSQIKKQISMNVKKFIEEGDMEAYAGNKAKAREWYLKAIYKMDVLKDCSHLNGDNKPYPGMSRAELNNKIEEVSK